MGTNHIIKTDSTDHRAFFCKYCNEKMRITGVDNFKRKKETHFWYECPKCEAKGKTKFYWKPEIISPVHFSQN